MIEDRSQVAGTRIVVHGVELRHAIAGSEVSDSVGSHQDRRTALNDDAHKPLNFLSIVMI